jgi:hypothetical protein
MYVFSGPDKIISLTSGTTTFDVENLYSNWKNWVQSGTNSSYLPAFATIGGDPISTAKSVAPYYFIKNGWRVRPWEANHQLEVEGNLFVDGGAGNPFIQTTGFYNVFINISTSSDSTITTVTNTTTGTTPTLTRIEQKVDDLTALSL